MKFNFYKSTLAVFCYFLIQSLSAQFSPSGQVNVITPSILSGCSSDTIFLDVTNSFGPSCNLASPTDSIEFIIEIPDTVVLGYQAGSVGSVNNNANESSYSAGVLTLKVLVPSFGTTDRVHFVLNASCEISTLTPLPQFEITANYPSGFPTLTENWLSSKMNVGLGELTFSHASASQISIVQGFNYAHNYAGYAYNTGFGSITEVTYHQIIHDSLYGRIANVDHIYVRRRYPTAQPATSKSAFKFADYQMTDLGNGYRQYSVTFKGDELDPENGSLDPGEGLQINASYVNNPNSCIEEDMIQKQWVSYNCANGGVACVVPDTLYRSFKITAGKPILGGVNGNIDIWDGAPNKNGAFSFSNTGIGDPTRPDEVSVAFDTKLNLTFGGLLEIDNLMINGTPFASSPFAAFCNVSSFPAQTKTISFDFKDQATSDPDASGTGIEDVDLDGFWDDIRPGETVDITFTYTVPEEATGNAVSYDIKAGGTFTDYCRKLNGSSSSSLYKFGIKQKIPTSQETPVADMGTLGLGDFATVAGNFEFNYEQINIDAPNEFLELRLNYDKTNEILEPIMFLGNALTLADFTVEGLGANNPPAGTTAPDISHKGLTDTDSVLVYTLSGAEVALLFDGTLDNLVYSMGHISCDSFQTQTNSNFWELYYYFDAGSQPIDIAKVGFGYRVAEGCGGKPNYVTSHSDLYRSSAIGFTDETETTQVISSPAGKTKFYEGDTLTIIQNMNLSADWPIMEDIGQGLLRGNNFYGFRYNMHIHYDWDPSVDVIGSTAIPFTFIEDLSYVKITDTVNGNIIANVPLKNKDFYNWPGGFSSVGPANGPKVLGDNLIPYLSYPGGLGDYYCGVGGSTVDQTYCPYDAARYRQPNSNMYYMMLNKAKDRMSELRYLILENALIDAGVNFSPGLAQYKWEIVTKWDVSEDFNHQGNRNFEITTDVVRQGNSNALAPNGTQMGDVGQPLYIGTVLNKEIVFNGGGANYEANCGLNITNALDFNNTSGDYIPDEVRVPYKLDSMTVDLPLEYYTTVPEPVLSGTNGGPANSIQYNGTSIGGGLSGHLVFTHNNANSGLSYADFPRFSDADGNGTVWSLDYPISNVGTDNFITQSYQVPVSYFLRDEFDRVTILRDTFTISESTPMVTISTLGGSVLVDNGGDCSTSSMDVLVANNTLYGASNVFIAAESSATTTVLSIEDVDLDVLDPIGSNDTSTYDGNNLYAQLGGLAPAEQRVVRITFQTSSCNDSIKIYSNFGCNYPATKQPEYPSPTLDSVNIQFQSSQPNMLSAPVDGNKNIENLCDNQTLEVELRNSKNANLSNLEAWFILPQATNFVIGSAEIAYPSDTYESATTVTQVGDTVKIILSDDVDLNNDCGLLGSMSLGDLSKIQPANTVKFKIDVEFDECPIASKDEVVYRVKGENYCGNEVNTSGIFNLIYTGSTSVGNTYTLNSHGSDRLEILNTPLGVSTPVIDSLYTLNLTGPSTLAGDSLCIVLENDVTKFTLDNFTVDAPWNAPLSSINAEGRIVLKFEVPAGIASGDSSLLKLMYDYTPVQYVICSGSGVAPCPDIAHSATFFGTVSVDCLPALSCGTIATVSKGGSYVGRNVPCLEDTDEDGVPDVVDIDDDNDGILDVIEACGVTATDYTCLGANDPAADDDNDGTPNYQDSDYCTLNANGVCENLDADGDGIINSLDLDADGDGLTDAEESSWSNSYSDTDNDGIVGTGVFVDTDGDGWSDIADNDNGGVPPANQDTDGDGIPNYLDVDSDGDGITDNVEGVDPNSPVTPSGNDIDGDGIDDAYDVDEIGATSGPDNTDTDMFPNYLDIDSDNDGIIDNIEFQTTSGYQAPGADTDGNGIADNYETAPGSGIMVNAPNDQDGTDLIPDYLDTDSDNDGISDVSEGHFGGLVPTGNDSDGDGLDDAFDSDLTGTTNNGGATNNNENVLNYPNNQDATTLEVDFRDPSTGIPVDTDGDGITDDLDVDDDNDGILDVDEALGFTTTPNIGDDCGYPATNFDGNSLISGTAGAVGAQYRFSNIATVRGNVIDAIVEITNVAGGASLITIDNGSTPEWQPEFNVTGGLASTSAMSFQVSVVLSGTTTPFPLDRFGGVIYDIDGANARESVILGRPGLYATATNTLLTTTNGPNPGEITFLGPDDTYAGIALGPKLAMYFNYYNVPTFDITFSSVLLNAGPNTNLGSVSFDICAINGLFDPSNPNSDPISQPGLDAQNEPSGPSTGYTYVVNDGPDTDNDGISDDKDLDSDNDGIPDVIEAGGTDSDGDGHPDNGNSTIGDYDATDVTIGVTDNGLPAILGGTPIDPIDTDNDGISDYLDLDSDNDGIADVIEAGGTDPDGNGEIGSSPVVDQDQDGFADIVDPLTDDGQGTQADSGNDPVPNPDSDGDGHVDYLDLDSDNDGIADVIEAGGKDPDGDGQIGTGDITDANSNGWSEDADFNEAGNTLPYSDTDNDGLNNWIDIDADNDGIMDIVETGGVDIDGDGHVDYPTDGDPSTMVDTDDDGFADVVDTDDNGTNIIIEDTDNDGLPNYLDIDADNDGIVDNSEGQSTDGYIAPAGNDLDNDGLDDAYDSDNQNIVGTGDATGTVIDPVNTDDSADNPDYLDLDSDDDGFSDAIEGWDTDNDGVADIVPSGDDADEDGLDDAFDTVVLDGTTGVDGTNGTNNTNPNTYPDLDNQGGDRDWRSPQDSDNDGIADINDLDDDNDGILDVDENNGIDPTADLDGDGIPQYLDDDDNDILVGNVDGLPENDTDGDGIPDHLDLDSDNDGIADLVEAGGDDVDGDGVLDTQSDADNDGIPDAVDIDETQGSDINNDGIDDAFQNGTDTDGDGINDANDSDANGNGVADVIDNTPLPNTDTDNDGVVDALDLDSDNDGIADIIEAGGIDTNGDGQVDYTTPGDPTTMPDIDGDGFADDVDQDDNTSPGANDGGQNLPNLDTDKDGIPNNLDLDSDNDGISDIIESGSEDPDGDGLVPVNPDGTLVTDGDNDGLTDDPIVDTDNDGIADQPVDTDVTGGEGVIPTNTDANGNPDYLDIDSDDDGITDIIEAGGIDTDMDGHVDYPVSGDPSSMTDADGDGLTDDPVVDTDNDGVADQPVDTDVTGGVSIANTDTDMDGLPNAIDIDADNDGIVDNIEGQSTEGYTVPLGTDLDMDGLDDAYDSDNDSIVGIGGGQGVSIDPENTDNVDTPDYIDLDSDNDDQSDVEEAWDLNGDDDLTGDLQPSGNDSDNDGLDDAFDVDGTSPINNGGATNGGQEPTDGSIANADNASTIELDWREGDSDGDGISDIIDLDDDNDGIPDSEEDLNTDGDNNPATNPTDTDGDGIPNYLDLDSDNDGIADLTEAGGIDEDKDGRIDTMEDDDFDGIPNSVDVDNTMGTDANLDGIDDQFQGGTDSDGDGIQDSDDPDSDADGIADIVDNIDSPNNGNIIDAVNGTPLPNPDTDNDGIRDGLDLDSDNDGITDIIEAGGVDLNGDGEVDYTTPGDASTMEDVDGDGYADAVDPENDNTPVDEDGGVAQPNDDIDNDGIPNSLDLDSDNDGISDIIESGSEDPDGDGRVPVNADGTLANDTDNDGLTDDAIVDTDNDGVADQPVDTDVTGGVAVNPTNTDGTGNPNYLDIDSDDDGITDVVEAGGIDSDGDGHVDYPVSGDPSSMTDADNDGLTDDAVVDTDKDGVADQAVDVDVTGGVAIPNTDTDMDGLPDAIDIDADNDGIVDNIEGQTTSGYVPPTGVDTDGDGLDDSYDGDNESLAGIGNGAGVSVNPTDTDLDGTSDWLDLDSDNDGEIDAIEGHDFDGDGVADVTPSGVDADNDGLDDAFDDDDTMINPTNDQTPTGDFADVDLPGIGDMDWREIDNDGDGINDMVDLDDDNDGIPDYVEICGPGATDFTCASDPSLDDDGDGILNMNDPDNCTLNVHGICESLDTDTDGIPDVFDLDTDNDGIADIIEGGGEDTNGDGVVDNINPDGTLSDDVNNDGISDDNILPNPPDFDNDGKPDFQDVDADNDGIYDIVEDGGEDTDNNGLVDSVNPDGTLSDDPDGDGWTNTTPLDGQEDTDEDGNPDRIDLDSDNDGIADIIEDGGSDSDNDGMIDNFQDPDGDGADNDDMTDGLLDTDDDGIPNHEDLDSDNDGIADIEEAGGEDNNDDGVIDDFIDADGNGWDDITGTSTPTDTDEDGNPDYTDLDSDDDGIDDVIEGHPLDDLGSLDTDGDGMIDNVTDTDGNGWDDLSGTSTSSVPDTDGDGIPDYQDSDSDNDGVNDDVEFDITNDGEGFDDCDGDGIPNYLDLDICDISIPQGFSPNGDGVNDFFVIDGLEYYPNSNFTVFNRWGNMIYKSKDGGYANDWDGSNNNEKSISIGGTELPVGTYFYIFEPKRDYITEGEGKVEVTKGYIYLNR